MCGGPHSSQAQQARSATKVHHEKSRSQNPERRGANEVAASPEAKKAATAMTKTSAQASSRTAAVNNMISAPKCALCAASSRRQGAINASELKIVLGVSALPRYLALILGGAPSAGPERAVATRFAICWITCWMVPKKHKLASEEAKLSLQERPAISDTSPPAMCHLRPLNTSTVKAQSCARVRMLGVHNKQYATTINKL
eukprot:CAMPEP_0170342996 /NCGR_PEP_ID=MMETSP0116_2-20130129/72667_1 /TAXON_ID=400756 /ORGANISM="Durinskia baltica, Strain CSIRO CS-38" /LENGTH=199 /DNA_ID=CAMNT_0010596637 /DNA_START=78 /DNA_END=677 /DNA_ORIENTATION=+